LTDCTSPLSTGTKPVSMTPVAELKARMKLRVTLCAVFVSPGGLALVKVPPTMILLPTSAIEKTVPSLMLGVLVDGVMLTSVD